MDIVIATTLVDSLRYRLYAQADLPADGPDIGQTLNRRGRAETRHPRDRLAVATREPQPPARRLSGQVDALSAVLKGAEPGEVCVVQRPSEGALAQWSAAVRALRERTYREVQAQIEHFIRTTGRDWQLQSLAYGEPVRGRVAAGESQRGATARLTLVTDVVLAARAPRLH